MKRRSSVALMSTAPGVVMPNNRYLRLQQTLGLRFELLGEINRGKCSCVLKAQDLKHHRPVAIKVLSPEHAAVIGSERFLREIEFVAGLQHPHILPLYDSGEVEGTLYYVMPYVEGGSLQQRLTRETRLSVSSALEITAEVCAALAYAHAHNIIHRDIKPSNILLESGYAVVSDFGFAHAIEAARAETLTPTGCVVGTPSYMSPEQMLGHLSDGRSDLYSVGCVLYEMLSGQRAFDGPSRAIICRKQIEVAPLPVARLRSEVPPELESVVQKVLDKRADKRYQNADAFVDALSRVPESRTVRFTQSSGTGDKPLVTQSRPS